MKKLIGIDEKLTYFTDDVKDELPTMRALLRAAVGMYAAQGGEQAIELYQLGLKLRMVDNSGTIDIEDAEFKLLKKVCEENPVKWIAHFQGQVLSKLKESEK